MREEREEREKREKREERKKRERGREGGREGVIYNQINSFMENKISKSVTGFRKSHGRHSLIVMLEKWKKALDKEENMSAIFMDLSKALDTINHYLLLAKLKVYGFSKQALSFMCSYLKNRRQRVQINNKFSSFKEIAGVPQGAIDGPLLFNLFIYDLFFFFFSFVSVL